MLDTQATPSKWSVLLYVFQCSILLNESETDLFPRGHALASELWLTITVVGLAEVREDALLSSQLSLNSQEILVFSLRARVNSLA